MVIAAERHGRGKRRLDALPIAVSTARTGRPSRSRNAASSSAGSPPRPRRKSPRSPPPARRVQDLAGQFASTSPGARRQRSLWTPTMRAFGTAPRAAAWRRLSITRKQPTEPMTTPPPAQALPKRNERSAPQNVAHRVVQKRIRPLRVEGTADETNLALSGLDPGAGDAQRVGAGASSPMKVRDEPITPCTIEMLPASRLDSCARNNVGRRSASKCSFRNRSGFSAFGKADRIAASTA